MAFTPIGNEFRVNTVPDIGQEAPAIGADANGNFVVTWLQDPPTSDYAIFAQRYDREGRSLGDKFKVDTTSRRQPAIAVDANGDFLCPAL
jgi:hypothetical protein